MPNAQLLGILLAAMVAGIILFRLYQVLGRRTGHERPPQKPRIGGNQGKVSETGDNVVALPDRGASQPQTASDPLSQALLDIKLADRAFENDHFVSGARAAYEMIVTAFAAGNRAALRPLLSEEVFHAFEGAIAGREARKEKVSYTFVGFKSAKIVHAALKGTTAEVTVAFEAQFISATTNEAGAVIEGDGKAVRDVTDNWTFARDTRARDPNWTLIATSGAEF